MSAFKCSRERMDFKTLLGVHNKKPEHYNSKAVLVNIIATKLTYLLS